MKVQPTPLQQRTILIFPEITDVAAMKSLLPRIAYYLWPVRQAIGAIHWAGSGEALQATQYPDLPNADLAPDIADIMPKIAGLMQQAGLVWQDLILPQHDLVLVWQEAALPRLRSHSNAPVFMVDPESLHEGDQWIEAGHALAASAGIHPAPPNRFGELQHLVRARTSSRISYVLGTGPSLAAMAARDTSDGFVIGCNSLVRNTALLDHLKPAILAAGDPIFHAGCSAYAAAFRQYLTEAMDRHPMALVIQDRDWHLYKAYLPERLHSRIFAVPVVYANGIHADMAQAFKVHATQNILTLLMVPLAYALADEIRIGGCDGRPLEEEVMFWRHDPASQIGEHMAGIRRCHPGFFSINQDQYYLLHCETLRRWVKAGEATGKRIVNLTPSHIPALAERSADGVPAKTPSFSARVRFFVFARLIFWHRSLKTVYGSWLRDPSTSGRAVQLVSRTLRLLRRFGPRI